MKKAVVALLAMLGSAHAQPVGQLPADTVLGKLGAQGPAEAVPFVDLAWAMTPRFKNCLSIYMESSNLLPEKEVCERAPLFVWNNPPSAGNADGKSMGCQFWVGQNPTATPQGGTSLNCTMYIDNYTREYLFGLNIVTMVNDLGPGWNDTTISAVEVEVHNLFAANADPDPFGSGPTRKNGLGVTTGFLNKGRSTVGFYTWAAEKGGGGWFDTSMAVSRSWSYGYRCIADPGGDVDTTPAFKTACFSDESDSANVLRISRAHNAIINMAANPTFADFVLGKTNAATDLRFRNASNYTMSLSIDSGGTAAQLSALTLSDRQTGKWSLLKDNGNNFAIQNQALLTQPFQLNGATDQATFSGPVAMTNTGTSYTLGSWGVGTTAGSLIGLARAVHIAVPSGSAGIEIGSGANQSTLYIASEGTYGQMATNGNAPLYLVTNNTVRMALSGNATHVNFAGNAPALTACGTSPAIVGTDAAGHVVTGTGATGCTVTFNTAYGGNPICVLSGTVAGQVTSYNATTTAIAVTTTTTSGVHFYYSCVTANLPVLRR